MAKLLRIFLILLMLAIVIGAGGLWYGMQQLKPVSETEVEPTIFEIPRGQAASIIAQRLTDEGYIRHPLALRWELQRQNLAGRVQAGVFEISPSMSAAEIAQQLVVGTNDIWITIPEGWRHEEIADFLETQELSNYDKSQFLTLSANSEGTLFPAKYSVPKDATATDLFNLLTATFDQKVIQGMSEEIEASQYSLNEILTMASIVEREAKTNDKAIVAGILWHRYEIGMALQVDATLQYVKGYNSRTQDWWSPPLAADKQLNSPFNTYQQAGLPPQPIANPGEAAIRATLNPVVTTDLFYIHDSQGRIHTAETLEGHNRNIDQYLR